MEQVCQILEISRSGFYEWLNRKPSDREKNNIALRKAIIKWLKGGFENPTMRFSKLYELFLAEKELLKGKSSGDLRNHFVGLSVSHSFLLAPCSGCSQSRGLILF